MSGTHPNGANQSGRTIGLPQDYGYRLMYPLPKPPKVPCGTCPYRKDVPSGIWDRSEYEKLPKYDGGTSDQFMKGSIALFMCHQRDGCLCGGWLLTHDPQQLAALRLSRVDDSVWDYAPDIEVWASGQEAHDHGIRDLDRPTPKACSKIAGIQKLMKLKQGEH